MTREQSTGGIVRIASGAKFIEAILEQPADSKGVVVFAHGSGSGRLSRAPTLLIVGGFDGDVIDRNEAALQRLGGSQDSSIFSCGAARAACTI